jgi:hypothetical protein
MRGLISMLVGVAVVLVGASQTFAEPVEWAVSDGGNGHWYELNVSPTPISWHQAEAAAEGRGGYLVTTTSQAETNFIISALGGDNLRYGWMGLYQDRTDPAYSEPAGGWKWITGEPLVYTNWCPVSGEPNDVGGFEDFGEFHGDFSTAVWCDLRDNAPNHFKYVVESVPEPSSLILIIISAISLFGYAWRRRR